MQRATMVEYFDADVMLEANFGGAIGVDIRSDAEDNGRHLGRRHRYRLHINAGGMDREGSLMLGRAPCEDGADTGSTA